MTIALEGGCLVARLNEGSPLVEGDLRIWNHFGPQIGARLSLRTMELRGEAQIHCETLDEVLYVMEGSGIANGQTVAPNTGISVPAGSTLLLGAAEPLIVISSQCPASGSATAVQIVRMEDCPAQRTGDRSYRELIQSEVTQFVGSIPPGRAPDHFHHYEEVLCILSGSGRMWAGSSSTPIEPGSCVFLPRRQVHCVENTSASDLTLLGVFYPAGSPAVRYPA